MKLIKVEYIELKILIWLPSLILQTYTWYTWAEFEDTKGVIRIRKSKDRQHKSQKKKDKRTNNDLKNTTYKNVKIE
jgi:hypothetical protein